MQKKLENLTRGLAVLLGLGAPGLGCSGTSETSSPPTVTESPQEVEASIEASFSRLAALDIVEAATLVSALPAEATSCYNLPCPDSKWVQPYQDERAKQAPRLAKLVELAESVAADPTIAPRDSSQAQAALDALAGLEIINAETLVEVKPANNPECYNLPCPADKAAADATNGKHVADVFAIVDAAKKAGL